MTTDSELFESNGQGLLFQPLDYQDELTAELMGERPPLTAQDWLDIADQMHDDQNYEAMQHALEKHEKAKRYEGTTEFLGGVSVWATFMNYVRDV